MLSNVLTVHVFFSWREKTVSQDTCAAGVATQSTVMRFFCVQLLSHVAFVSKHTEKPADLMACLVTAESNTGHVVYVTHCEILVKGHGKGAPGQGSNEECRSLVEAVARVVKP